MAAAENALPVWMQAYTLDELAEGCGVVDIDISTERILLQLTQEERLFLRIAQWDEALGGVHLIDSGALPAESYLDTYHDGDAVLLTMPVTEKSQIFITFKQLDDGWYLTSFTDGQTFTAKLCEQGYQLNDYYEPSEEYTWNVEGALQVEGFCSEVLVEIIEVYDTLMADRPSVCE